MTTHTAQTDDTVAITSADFNDTEASIIATHIDPVVDTEAKGDKNVEDQGASSNTQEQASQAGKQPSPSAGEVGGQKRNDEQRTQETRQGADSSRIKYDAQGNVVGPKGEIIARAGKERRFFEQTERATRDRDRVVQERDLLQQQLAEARVLNDLPKQYGLNNEQVAIGLKLASEWQRDPLATMQYLLTELQAMGHNINTLVGDRSAIDMASMARMMDQRLKPLTQEREQAQRREQIEREARQQYEVFISRHEHARVHEDAIARLLQANPHMSPDAAYFGLEAWAVKNGFDFTRPLDEQILARENGQQGTQSQGQSPAVTQVTPPMARRGSNAPLTDSASFASPNATWDEIVSRSMRESGYN